jgi:hypothetical protein
MGMSDVCCSACGLPVGRTLFDDGELEKIYDANILSKIQSIINKNDWLQHHQYIYEGCTLYLGDTGYYGNFTVFNKEEASKIEGIIFDDSGRFKLYDNGGMDTIHTYCFKNKNTSEYNEWLSELGRLNIQDDQFYNDTELVNKCLGVTDLKNYWNKEYNNNELISDFDIQDYSHLEYILIPPKSI